MEVAWKEHGRCMEGAWKVRNDQVLYKVQGDTNPVVYKFLCAFSLSCQIPNHLMLTLSQ